MSRRFSTALFAMTMMALATGCYSPKGGLMPATGGPQTYHSYETLPVTITIVDLRSNDEIFTMHVPPGKQLTFDFQIGEGDDPIYNPDLMRFEVFDMGTDSGKLRNTLSVPAADARRIDVTYRHEYEYRSAQGNVPFHPDQIVNRPNWTNSRNRITTVTNPNH
ncbi:MAG: hypothetical protein O7G85_01645 [Planctomycetota bacterium]|nr:hypothetical protein [Planctomycetota bacterium]